MFFLRLLLFILILLAPARVPAGSDRLEPAPLPPSRHGDIGVLRVEIRRILKKYKLSQASSGIKIIDLAKKTVIFKLHPREMFKPASNMKLVTSAAALALLGPEYEFSTRVLSDAEPVNGNISGNLYLVGGGDPFLVQEQLWQIVRQVVQTGVRNISGDVVLDTSFFESTRIPDADWKRIKIPFAYTAPTCALSLNFNTIGLRVDPGTRPGATVHCTLLPDSPFFTLNSTAHTGKARSRNSLIMGIKETEESGEITLTGKIPLDYKPQIYYRHVEHPALFCGHAFVNMLRAEGVRVSGKIRPGTVPDSAFEITDHASLPLSMLLRLANKYSNNFMIEETLNTIGAVRSGKPGSPENGIREVMKYLSDLGLDTRQLKMADGSGLSRNNRISPEFFVEMIHAVLTQSTFFPEFLNLLPVTGVDGTMKKRLKKTRNHRLIRAKTGVINGVTSLTGVLDGRGGEGIIFSMMFNNNHNRHGDCKKAEDQILKAMLKYWTPGT